MPITERQLWQILENVSDPEIPVLSVVDLGIVREARLDEEGTAQIVITPTYSGCPAMNTIEIGIKAILEDNGVRSVVQTVLTPAWTTDWMTESGKNKLQAYGIAPPEPGNVDKHALFQDAQPVTCPRCGSRQTTMLAQFGSTACKALYQCKDCLEPFDYFKCH
ncbi:MAG: 1,2-phenylacetyl-CoA epoxidase subunit PaaD [Saprospiraceae bacterium]